VNGVVRVEGADPLPSVEGDLSLLGGTFALSGQTATVGPLDGDVRLAGTQANFQRLSLASRKGRAEISGRVGWSRSGVTDVSLQIFFEHFLFNQLGLLRTYLDGNLVTSGPLDALTVTGAIQMSDVRVSFPSQQDPILKEIRVLGLPDAAGSVSIYEGEGEIAGLDANTRVDVAFVIPPGTWVRGMGLDAEIIGQLRVTKQPKSPLRYLGQFEVEHGRYTLQGKRFELERGVAVFGDTEEAIPYVDIVASRQASRDVRVTAHLTGRADAPRLQLTSVPPMDSAEIVSYLFFGGARTSEGGGAGSDIGTSAASVVGAMLLDNVSPELREQLRIDQISITSEAEDEAPALEIETQITPDVYLRLIQSLGATADEAAEIRWRFYRNFNLKSRVQRSGESSIDLLWAYDFWGLDLSGLKSPPPPYGVQTAQDVGEPCQPPDECAK
jgi:translocation and assembly module TamB